MLKKTILILMALILIWTVCAVAEEEVTETAVTVPDPFRSWQGCVGDIAFALPGMPDACVQEYDWKEEWTDCYMIWGNCVYDSAEYQLRHADIAEVIEAYRKAFPDKDAEWIKYNALYYFASWNIKAYDGETDTPQVDPDEQIMYFNYTYPDTPDSSYRAKCCLDGTRAVCFFMEECDHCDRAMFCLARMTEKQKAKQAERKPYMLNFFNLPMTFPHEPYVGDGENITYAFCFADDYTRIIAQFTHIALVLDIDDLSEAESSMKSLAEKNIERLGGGKILEGKLSGDKSQWEYDYRFLLDYSFNDVVPEAFTWAGRMYCGENGIWNLMCDDTETGRAWLDSVGEIPRETFESIIRMEGDILLAEPRKADGSPATLRQFCKDFIDLLKADEDGGLFYEDDSLIGDAIWSDGKWVRTMLCGYGDMFLTLYLSSDSEDAQINEIHVIVQDEQELSSFNTLSSCCIQAAEGSADPAIRMLRKKTGQKSGTAFSWKGNRYEAVQSHVDRNVDFPYHLMTITALNPVPLQREPEEGWDEEKDYPVPAVTVGEFCSRWYQLNWNIYSGSFALQEVKTYPMDDGSIVHGFAFGDMTLVMLTAKTEDEDAGIVRVQVYNMNGNAPEASLGGLMALAAVTNMPDDQYMLLISMLQEKPTWQDQIDSLPVAGWGGKLMVVCEHEDDEGVIPAAYILDMPMAD